MSSGAVRPIRRLLILTQTHTDMGYTDHADALRYHHRDIMDEVLELCEATESAPRGAQFRWTCEVTSTTLDYLRSTTSRNVDRFLRLHRDDRMAVAAMRHHWTPLVSPLLAVHTLKDVDALRNEFGIGVRSAMQCDVNGLAWFWIGLLRQRGVNFLMMQQNPHRGYWGCRVPSAWNWQDRDGTELLVFQAEHYGMGGSYLLLSHSGRQETADLLNILDRHSKSPVWPFDFSVLTVTNRANGDNVFPDRGLSRAVADWNAENELQMEIVTLDQLNGLFQKQAQLLPSYSGDWVDSWCDGEASTPLETAVARAAERLLQAIEAVGGTSDPAFAEYIDSLALYDEHTWGAHCSASAPGSPFTIMQRTHKSCLAHRAHALGLRILAKASRKQVPEHAGPVEGDPGFGAVSDDETGPDQHGYLVANPAGVPLEVDWPVPFDRGAGPQICVPQFCGTDHYLPGFGEDGWTDRLQNGTPDGNHRIRVSLPPGGVSIVRPVCASKGGLAAGEGWAESPLARLELCPETGGIRLWRDHASERVILGEPTLFPTVQLLKCEYSRRDIFRAPYWERSEEPMGWNAANLFQDDGFRVEFTQGRVDAAGAHAGVEIRFDCGIAISACWSVSAVSPWLRLVAAQRVASVSQALSIFWPVQAAEFDQRMLVDTGKGLIDPAMDHVPSSCLRWLSMQSGLALEGEKRNDCNGVSRRPAVPTGRSFVKRTAPATGNRQKRVFLDGEYTLGHELSFEDNRRCPVSVDPWPCA